MEMFATTEFWGGLLAIVWVNILLSGDNAVVIALAARSLPPQQKRQAIAWGSAAAIAMRLLLTVVAVELLKLPFLKIVGGALLLWIAVQLLVPGAGGNGAGKIRPGGSLGAAVRTIMFADLVMSLDNVIGVVAAARDNLVLLVFGIAIGIPLIIFGSTLMLKVMDRYPLLVVFGAALLGYIAGEMLVGDPAVQDWVAGHAHWLQDAVPGPLDFSIAGLFGAVAVVVVGKLLAARAGPEKIVDLVEQQHSD